MTTYYDILNLNINTNINEIKKKYKELIIIHHPDKGGNTVEFNKIITAYSILSDPIKKQEYDYGLSTLNKLDIFDSNYTRNSLFDLDAIINNHYSKSSSVYIDNNIQIQKTIEIKNGKKFEYTKETNLLTDEIKENYKRLK